MGSVANSKILIGFELNMVVDELFLDNKTCIYQMI